MERTLVIRADAGRRIGTGHVMRCLALAQAWQDFGGSATFAMSAASEGSGMESRLRDEKMSVVYLDAVPGGDDDASQTGDLARSMDAAFVVVDGYQFGSAYQMRVRKQGCSLLFVDDYGHADRYFADLILNQNSYASESLYCQREPCTGLLLGAPFVLMRREFRPWRTWRRHVRKDARRVLVTLGGSDPDGVTSKVIAAMKSLNPEDLEAVVVVGRSNPGYDALLSTVDGSPIRLVRDAREMPDLMAWADVAISSGGTTSLELAFMGLPSAVIVLAENQVRVAEELDRRGAAWNLGWHDRLSTQELGGAVRRLIDDYQARSAMAQRGRDLVDGYGVDRVLGALAGRSIEFRDARREDCSLIYQWANDPDVRRWSFSSRPVAWGDHVVWFERKLQDPCHLFFIAQDLSGRPIGQARFEIEGDDSHAIISISLDRGARGRGLGCVMILKAIEALLKRWSVSRVDAYIKSDNALSISAFEGAGFQRGGTRTVKGHDSLYYAKAVDHGAEASRSREEPIRRCC